MESPTKAGRNTFKVSLIYKSRSLSADSDSSIPLSKCYIIPSLMKSLNLKGGSLICLEHGNGTQFLSKAWPNKQSQISGDNIFLNKCWQPTFDGNEKKIVVNNSLLSRIRIFDAQIVEFSIDRADLSSNQIASVILFVKHVMQETYCQRGLKFSIPLNGAYYTCEILNIRGNSSAILQGSSDDDGVIAFFAIGAKTQFNVKKSSEMLDTINKSNISKSGRCFAGYAAERQKLFEIASLGLGLTENVPGSRKRHPRGVLISGPPGTGKTQLAYDIIDELQCTMFSIDYHILLNSIEGEAEIAMRKVFLEAMISSPSCILLDDFDLLCPSRSSSNATEIQKRIVTCFLSLVDELNSKPSSPVFLIACTSKPLDIDDAAKRAGRIDFEIELSIPTEHDRFDILSFLLQKGNVSMVSTREFLSSSNSSSIYYVLEENIKEISKIAHGMVGADLLQLIKESFHFCAIRERNTTIEGGKNTEDQKLSNLLGNLSLESKPESEAEETKPAALTSKWIEVTFADFSDALKKVSPSSLREVTVEIPTVRWTDIGGMDKVKQSLKEVIELPLKHPELFKNSGLTPLKGILLYGPPGCSKTLMAKAVATETSMNFLAVRGPELLSKWLGDSEKAVQSLFRKARAAAPSIIFFDEIDALAGKRGDSSSGVSDRVLSQLLIELDGINNLKQVIVIAATNRPDMLDPALIRPGRVDRKIYVPPPDALSRESILKLELSKLPLQEEPIDYQTFVEQSEGFSGAEMVAFCNDAVLEAIEAQADCVTSEHLLTALGKVKPQITEQMIQFYLNFAAKNR